MIKFAEATNAALGNADSDVNRSVSWLEMEAKPFWQSEIRKRQLKLAQAQEALRMKTLYKNFDGTTPSSVDEQKAVHIAKQRLEIANQKLVNVQKYLNRMQKEAVLYKGAVQRFSTTIQGGTPVAIAMLGRVMEAIEQYLLANPEMIAPSGGMAGEAGKPGYLDFLAPVKRTTDEVGEKIEKMPETAEPASTGDEPAAVSADSTPESAAAANQTASAESKEQP